MKLLLYILIGMLALVIFIILSLWTVKKMKDSSSEKNLWAEYIPADKGLIVAAGIYIFILYMIQAMLPDAWNWMWGSGMFWIIQGAVICTVLIFFMAPRWSRYTLLPVIMVIIGIFLIENLADDHGPRHQVEEGAFQTPPTEAEIKGFLSNPAPPPELQVMNDRGEIWDLEILFSGVVSRDEWSRVVEIPTPPRGRHYRFKTEVLAGQIEVMNRGEYQGRHPNPRLQIISHRPLRLQYRSAEFPQNAVVVWRWTQGRY